MKTIFAALLAAFALLTPARAFVYTVPGNNLSGPNLFWNLTNPPVSVSTNVVNRTTKAIRYVLASDGFSAANKTNELNAIRASFGQWQSVPNTVLKFEDAGLVAPRVDMVNAGDGTNIIYWEKTSNLVNGGTSDITFALGIAFTTFNSSGLVSGGDIVFNGRTFQGDAVGWFTDFNDKNNANYFVESVALHEIGHFLGLQHSTIGGATMLYAGQSGVDTGAGLSADEVAFARTTYPASNILATLGNLKGQITIGAAGVFGAAVIVEGTNGNLIGGTVTRSNGLYQLTALPVGTHRVRVCPLDPFSGERLIAGSDIGNSFGSPNINFLPTTNSTVTLTAGTTNTLNLSALAGTPPFRISYLRRPSADTNSYSIIGLPVLISPGQSNFITGVFSSDLPTSGASLAVSGDGITLGPPRFHPGTVFVGLNGISALISVASNATPGLRTITVTQGTNRANANGFLEIVATQPDYNFDGVADTFQRQFFPVFTATNAAPTADPDNDKMDNLAESVAGTNPTNAASLLKLLNTTTAANGTTIRWQSVSGKRYQVLSRTVVNSGTFTNVGAPVTANSALTTFLHAGATTGTRYYRVQVLP